MMSHKARIRTATAGDVVRIAEIARAAYAKYVPRIGREPAPVGADYGAQVAARRVVVVETGETVCGYMVAWPEADAYFIDNIAVHPGRQGEGLGGHMIEHAAMEAISLNLGALRLYTNVQMTENLSMYAHLGFVETDRQVEQGFYRVYFRRTLA
jgi:ribosomal protein S18 acetylase RimI-like enzyme